MRHRINALVTILSISMVTFVSITPRIFGQDNRMVNQGSGYVSGTVRSISSGAPVSSVLVIASQDGSERGRSLTGEDGRYYIGNLEDGEYQLIATRANRQVRHTVVLPQDRGHDINDF